MFIPGRGSILACGQALLIGGAESATIQRIQPRDAAISGNLCLDIDNSEPPALKYGYPSWRTADQPNCASKYRVDHDGHCISHLSPTNGCNSFCQVSNAWFYGEPMDAMDGKWCELGQSCAKTITISHTGSDSTVFTSSENYHEATSSKNGTSKAWNRAISLNLGFDASTSADISYKPMNLVKPPTVDASKAGDASAAKEQLKAGLKNFGVTAASAAAMGGAAALGSSVAFRGQEAASEEEKSFNAAARATALTSAGMAVGSAVWSVAAYGAATYFGAPELGGLATTFNPLKLAPSSSMSKSRTFTSGRTELWDQSVQSSKDFGVTNSTSFAIQISEADSLSKPSYASDYCGSWFAVPIVGVSCGRGAKGRLIANNQTREMYCALEDQNEDSFSHCFSYTFRDYKEVDVTRYRWAFVLRDCHHGFILPGEWQPPHFQNSFSPEVYTRQHIERYGYSNLPEGLPEKPADDDWIFNGEKASDYSFTKIKGPENHTIEVCSPGDYCVRHKLTDGNCHNLPRGHTGVQAVNIISAKTTPGNCCTMFSRHECHGVAQNVNGTIDKALMKNLGYSGQAHSIVCNVDQYCNHNMVEQITQGRINYLSLKAAPAEPTF